jgi:hypothetical protein
MLANSITTITHVPFIGCADTNSALKDILRKQLAGLLHNVAHSAFSNLTSYMLKLGGKTTTSNTTKEY